MDGRRGLFITFEGPEGAGKSLQARALADRLQDAGAAVLRTREPGGTPIGDRLRAILLNQGTEPLTARAEALLMCASRATLVESVIVPALGRGEVVVCDRFADSTLAYQGFGRGLDVQVLREVISFATADTVPDVTFLLDIDVRQGLSRKAEQDGGPARGAVGAAGSDVAAWNRIEAEAVEFHERVRAGYLRLAGDAPERWRVLDARQTPERLQRVIWDEVSPLLAAGHGADGRKP